VSGLATVYVLGRWLMIAVLLVAAVNIGTAAAYVILGLVALAVWMAGATRNGT
jgi:hypothetical protein